jgi:thiamine-phosphate diphosphorylase
MLTASHPAFLLENVGTVFRGIHGVHLPEGRFTVEATRRILSPGSLVGRSVHSVEGAEKAADEGADYLLTGTIFASQSHPGLPPAGVGFLRDVCAAVSLPVLAIGGVTPQNLGLCLNAGAVGVAVLSQIMQASDPQAAAQAYRTALNEAWSKRQ